MKNNDIKNIRIADFDYCLSDDRIAKYPLQQRDQSKLLVYDDGTVSQKIFSELPTLIPENSFLIFNNTRVIHARLRFRKSTGAHIEIFCLAPHSPKEYTENFAQNKACEWECMIGNAKRWKNEPLSMTLSGDTGNITLTAEKISHTAAQSTIVHFAWNDNRITFSELLERVGQLPIPPYLNRPSESKDDETYQTVYSKIDGSVAAPTAGLHFTENVMQALHQKHISTDEITLHVGAGTFKPVKSDTIGEHAMHTEFISVSEKTIQRLLDCRSDIVAVGTTSVRTLESLYYIGCQLEEGNISGEYQLFVNQWEPYSENLPKIPREKALANILAHLDATHAENLFAHTQIMIVPGYQFKFVDTLITNFHQPQSTLLLLIAAFVGDDWRKIYDFALQNNFRFLSYGDSSILRKKR